MKREVKRLDENKREITVEVSGEAVKNKFEEVFARITKEAKVPGFRPGHAPRDMIEKNYSGQAHEQVLKELVPDIYYQAVKEEALDVIELPEITDVKLNRDNLSFKATVEVSPEFEVKDYRGIAVGYKKIGVDAEEIKRGVDALKEARKAEAADNSLAKSLGYPDLAELEKALEKQIYLQKENQQRQKIEAEIVDKLSKGLDFKLPQALLARQLQDLLRQAKIDLALKGVPKEKIDAEEENLSKELEPVARNQVRVYLILSRIAKKENIPIDEQMPRKVMEFLLREARWQESS